MNINLLKNIFSLLSGKEQRRLKLLFLAFIVTGLFEIAGIASIAPFMAVVSSPEIIQDNHYLNSVYVYFEFNNTNEFLIMLGVTVILLLGLFGLFVLWRIDSPRVEKFRALVIDTFVPSFEWMLRPMTSVVKLAQDYQSYEKLLEQNKELRREQNKRYREKYREILNLKKQRAYHKENFEKKRIEK